MAQNRRARTISFPFIPNPSPPPLAPHAPPRLHPPSSPRQLLKTSAYKSPPTCQEENPQPLFRRSIALTYFSSGKKVVPVARRKEKKVSLQAVEVYLDLEARKVPPTPPPPRKKKKSRRILSLDVEVLFELEALEVWPWL